jgi:uncharacterized protein (TIGR02271 family)
MAVQRDLNRGMRNEVQSGMGRVVAFFPKRENAYSALSNLKAAGFDQDHIGLAVGHGERATQEYDTSFWQKVKGFFTGEDHHDDASLRDVSTPMGWTDERYKHYERGISSGGALVSVTGERLSEARQLLQRSGGDLRDTGFEASSAAGTVGSVAGTTGIEGEQRIQLRGEMLRTYKERVKRGEVRIHKDVITENQSVQVPVTREELVLERTPASGQRVTGEIGRDEEIRVPLTEERVRVEKQPVVNEEIRVGKRQVQTNQEVSDKVRHEELRVDKDGIDNEVETEGGRRKDRAA